MHTQSICDILIEQWLTTMKVLARVTIRYSVPLGFIYSCDYMSHNVFVTNNNNISYNHQSLENT